MKLRSPASIRLYAASLAAMALLALAPEALGASRVAHFSASGRSQSDGVRGSLVAECTITITNPSTVSQTYTVNALRIRATDTVDAFSASYHGNATAMNSPCVSNCALAADTTAVIVYQYPQFSSDQVGEAHLVCEGSIEARDTVAGTQGFLIATGTLSTFMPTSSADVQVGAFTRTVKGSISFSHLQLLIGEGRPF